MTATDDDEYKSDEDDTDHQKNVEEKILKLQTGIKSKKTWNFVKRLVSKNKKRFACDGFDLDLSYITENVIAMGFPSEGFTALYRNSMKDVKAFFNRKFYNKYKVYNLCSENDFKYDDNSFQECDQTYTFDDHNPPPFNVQLAFCKDVHQFLSKNPENVVAIHCKAGKGRTGVMICCYLVYSQLFKTAIEALEYYGKLRTHDNKGVTIPSQIRYIHYFANYI